MAAESHFPALKEHDGPPRFSIADQLALSPQFFKFMEIKEEKRFGY